MFEEGGVRGPSAQPCYGFDKKNLKILGQVTFYYPYGEFHIRQFTS